MVNWVTLNVESMVSRLSRRTMCENVSYWTLKGGHETCLVTRGHQCTYSLI